MSFSICFSVRKYHYPIVFSVFPSPDVLCSCISSLVSLLSSLSRSYSPLQRGVLEETRDAAQVLQAVLSGQRSEEISSALTRRQLSEDKWWTAVSRVVQGLALMAKQVQAKLEADGSLRDSASSSGAAAGGRWAQLAATGEEMAGGRVV
ncbi:unnamed protein product [Closterium sp. NIES-54]